LTKKRSGRSVQIEVQFQEVHARLAKKARQSAQYLLSHMRASLIFAHATDSGMPL
jgi:hypothetical protein